MMHTDPNHVLMNYYPVDTGIMPHKDGSAYHPLVAIISLNDAVMLKFYSKLLNSNDTPHAYTFAVLCQPRSCIVFTDDLYSRYYHGIDTKHHIDVIDERVLNSVQCGYHAGDTFQRTASRY
jgi:alkylated DNA repair protein alkB family protein 6